MQEYIHQLLIHQLQKHQLQIDSYSIELQIHNQHQCQPEFMLEMQKESK